MDRPNERDEDIIEHLEKVMKNSVFEDDAIKKNIQKYNEEKGKKTLILIGGADDPLSIAVISPSKEAISVSSSNRRNGQISASFVDGLAALIKQGHGKESDDPEEGSGASIIHRSSPCEEYTKKGSETNATINGALFSPPCQSFNDHGIGDKTILDFVHISPPCQGLNPNDNRRVKPSPPSQGFSAKDMDALHISRPCQGYRVGAKPELDFARSVLGRISPANISPPRQWFLSSEQDTGTEVTVQSSEGTRSVHISPPYEDLFKDGDLDKTKVAGFKDVTIVYTQPHCQGFREKVTVVSVEQEPTEENDEIDVEKGLAKTTLANKGHANGDSGRLWKFLALLVIFLSVVGTVYYNNFRLSNFVGEDAKDASALVGDATTGAMRQDGVFVGGATMLRGAKDSMEKIS